VNSSNSNNVTFLEHVVVPLSLSIQGLSQSQTVGISDLIDNLNAGGDIPSFLEAQNDHPKRGDIRVELTSPQGTVSVLLPNRGNDFINDEGYSSWPFMSVHHWGEDPIGQWTLRVTFSTSSFTASARVQVTPQTMRLYGTTETPAAVAGIPSTCHQYCARGCSGPTAADCDVCRDYRLNSTLECVTACPQGTTEQNSYCFDMQTATTTSTETGTTTTDPITTTIPTANTTTVNIETATTIPTDVTTIPADHEQTTDVADTQTTTGVADTQTTTGVADTQTTTGVADTQTTTVSPRVPDVSSSSPTTSNIPAITRNDDIDRNSSSFSRPNFLINLVLVLFAVALVKIFNYI
jgi:hypothetical protein